MATRDEIGFREIPLGNDGMRARPNRLRASVEELLDAEGCTFENGSAMKEAGAVKLDAVGIVPAANIIALFDFNPETTAAGTGTVSTTAGLQTVVGVGTLFLTEVNVGDRVRIPTAGAETIRVIAVTSNTVLTVDSQWKNTNAGVTFTIFREQRLASATDGGDLYLEINADLDWAHPVTGLTKSLTPGRFVQGGKESSALPRKLFYFSGRDPVQVIRGDTFTGAAIALPPSDWTGANQPVNGVLHDGRLIAWGNENDPHRIYVSNADNTGTLQPPFGHEDFRTVPISMRLDSGIGNKVWCGVEFNGLLFLWKHPFGLFYLCDNAPEPDNWCIRTKSTAIGCAPSPYAVLPVDDDVLFMAADGSFHLLNAVAELGGARSSDLSYAIGLADWLRENVNLSRLDLVQSTWFRHKKCAYFSVPGTGSLVNNLILKWDFGDTPQAYGGGDSGTGGAGLPLRNTTKNPVKFSYTRRDAAGALAQWRYVDHVERTITGEGAFVYLQEQTARSKNGTGFVGAFQTPHLDQSSSSDASQGGANRGKRKRFESLEFLMNPVVGTLLVQVYVDQVLTQTLTIDCNQRRVRPHLNCGDGYTLSLRCSNSTLNESFDILSILVWMAPGNEDHSRRS